MDLPKQLQCLVAHRDSLENIYRQANINLEKSLLVSGLRLIHLI